jgi:uncharacterized protein (TIGR03435 family)
MRISVRSSCYTRAGRYDLRPSVIGTMLLSGIVLTAQVSKPPDDTSLAFEVATVKPIPPDDQREVGIQPLQPGGLFRAVGLTLREFLRVALGTPAALLSGQVVGGPAWIDTERFEIAAKVPDVASLPDSTPRAVIMLRGLLDERFKVTHHTEARELPVFDLVAATPTRRPGPGLQRTTVPCVSMLAANAARDFSKLCGVKRAGLGLLAGTGISMALLAGLLSHQPEVDRIVRDRTGLLGDFDVNLEWRPFSATADASAVDVSLFAALREQLGLRLDSATGPVDVLVIDHAERPTPD